MNKKAILDSLIITGIVVSCLVCSFTYGYLMVQALWGFK
jgi:hypothetical protein